MRKQHRSLLALTLWRRTQPNGSMEAAGRKLGVNKSTILRWENGDRRIPAERVREVSRITGLAPEVLRPDIFR
jgi:DNA-binding transcriptional regulator YdaS (Cro superfamily)